MCAKVYPTTLSQQCLVSSYSYWYQNVAHDSILIIIIIVAGVINCFIIK